MADKVETPADFVPLHAMAYGKEDEVAVPVSLTTPMPVASGVLSATMDARAFLASTPIVEAGTTESLFIKLSNTSARNLVLYNRIFSNNHGPDEDFMSYRAYINPTMNPSIAVPVANTFLGQPTSDATVSYQVSTDTTMGGIEGTGEQLPNGEPYPRRVLGVIAPGVSVGFSMQPTGNPQSSTNLSIILEWWEQEL